MDTATPPDPQATSQLVADAGGPAGLIDAAVTRRGTEGMFGMVSTLIVTPTKVDLTPLLK